MTATAEKLDFQPFSMLDDSPEVASRLIYRGVTVGVREHRWRLHMNGSGPEVKSVYTVGVEAEPGGKPGRYAFAIDVVDNIGSPEIAAAVSAIERNEHFANKKRMED